MDIWVQSQQKVRLTEAQITEAARYKLRHLLGGDGIKEDNGTRWVYSWYDTGHGSGITDYVREATGLDEALVAVLAELNKKEVTA